jgi:hypothetical protein
MAHSITLNLTEEQQHVLNELAAYEFRTSQNLLGMFICLGLSCHLENMFVLVKKPEQNLEHPNSHYSDAEIEAVLATLPFQGDS